MLVACTRTWLWAASHPLPTPRPRPLPRPAVREVVCSLLVLLRLCKINASVPGRAAGASALHTFMTSPQQRRLVQLPEGRLLTCDQQSIIQTVFPCTG